MKKFDISNGPGVRASLFTQGCPFRCKGCFNPTTWDHSGGWEFGESEEREFIEMAKDPNITGISILGGEPFYQCEELEVLLIKLRRAIGDGKEIWVWTGFEFEILLNLVPDVLQMIDVVVDGKYVEELFDPKLQWRGSANQRIIDVKKSIKEDSIKVLTY